MLERKERIINPPKIGDFCRFVDQDELVNLGYGDTLIWMSQYAGTRWKVIEQTSSWLIEDGEHIQHYFDLENEEGTISLSSIPDEILIRL